VASGLTVAPVVGFGSHAPARPHPVRTAVEHFQLAKLPHDKVAGQGQRALTATDEVATAAASGALVGLTWPDSAAPSTGTEVQVRGRTAAGTWTSWTDTEVNDEQDPAAVAAGRTPRVGTDPVWLGPVTRVQVRFASADAAAVRKARVEVVDPGTSPADAPASAPAGAAQANPAMPRYIRRAGWGADESIRTCKASYGTTTSAMVVHHTDGTNSYTKAQSAAIVRGIYAFHVEGRGWCDIGYNALVDKYGQVFEGRAGGMDLPVIGAHTGGFNTDTWGVSVLGTYTSVVPSSSAMSALTTLFAWRESAFYRRADSKSVLTSRGGGSRYPEGQKVTVPFILGHRDLWPTSCPGNAFYAKLGSVRSSTLAKTSYTGSVLYKRWAAEGGATGRLGPVLKGEGPVSFGRRTVFQGGWAMYAVGSSTRLVGPGLDGLYWANGGPGRWGYPLRDEYAIKGGTRADFSSGFTAIYSFGHGSHPVFGAIKAYWLGKGAGQSAVGFPTGRETVLASGGVLQTFSTGDMFYKSGLGAHAVHGAVLTAYTSRGGADGSLGYPVQDQVNVSGGVSQRFQGGTLVVPDRGKPTVVKRPWEPGVFTRG
jgi:uncharacterized protein with LGFP repeats